MLHYYVSRASQANQLSDLGFELVECLDLDGQAVGAGDDAVGCSELHYGARRSTRATGSSGSTASSDGQS